MLVPRKMRKVRIFSVKQNEGAILSALHDLGIFQVEQVSINSDALSPLPQSESYSRLSELARRIRDLEMSLYPNEVSEKKQFRSLKELVDAAEEIGLYGRIKTLKEGEGSALSSLKVLGERISAIERLSFYGGDLGYLEGENVTSFIIKKDEGIASKLSTFKDVMTIAGDKNLIVVVPRALQSRFGEFAKNEKIDLTPVPSATGTVKDCLAAEVAKKDKQMEELALVRAEISKISNENYANVAAIREQLDIELKKIDITSRLVGTKKSLVLEGWVPSEELKPMIKTIASVTDNQIVVEELDTDEVPPTSLKNPKGIKLFQFFIRFYSLPQSIEVDPTLIFALIFPIFFGLMIGDVGYGVFILVISLWLIHRVDHPPKVSHVPKFLARFVLMMMSKRSLKILAKAMLPGAMIAIALGVFFDEYFGFHLAYPHFEVLSSFGLRKLLLFAGYTGVAMVSFGLVLGLIVNITQGHKKEALGKIGWILVAYSIVILGLEVIYHNIAGLNPLTNHLALAAFPMLGAGLVLVLYSEKGQALLEITTIISHILSYTRLVGILLASVGLAYVFDFLFQNSLASHSVLLIILGFVILIVGQMLNLIIAIFEPGIQGARLIYVEFFSKFYKGNGKEFKPFSSPRNYTINQFVLEPLGEKERK